LRHGDSGRHRDSSEPCGSVSNGQLAPIKEASKSCMMAVRRGDLNPQVGAIPAYAGHVTRFPAGQCPAAGLTSVVAVVAGGVVEVFLDVGAVRCRGRRAGGTRSG
jgi:hypothetical protein